MNFIDKNALKEFEALLSKYDLSSTVYFENDDKHIQINLTIPDYFDEEKENLSCLQNLLNSQE
jgi:hypothetical protein